MFLFCVTRHHLRSQIHIPAVREFVAEPWVVTVCTDEWLSACARTASEISATEIPWFARVGEGDASSDSNDRAGLLFAAARFLTDDRAIEISRTLAGGRQLSYHIARDGGFFCGTHIRLLQQAGVPLEEDEAMMAELFVYRYITPPHTLFKNILQLLPGEDLRFEFDGGSWRKAAARQYSPPHSGQTTAPKRVDRTGAAYVDYTNRAHRALRESMQPLRPARDRVHVLASGGVDSSILYGIAQQELGTRDSYSTGYPFEDDEHNVEKRYALTAAEAFGARHRYFLPSREQFLRAAVEAVSVCEEPIIFPQSVLLLLLFRDGLPGGPGIVVSGQGADGLYGLRLHQAVGSIERFKATHPWLAPALHSKLWSAIARPVMSGSILTKAARAALTRLVHDDRALDVLTSSRWGSGVDWSDPSHVLWRLGATGSEEWASGRFAAAGRQLFASRAAALARFANRNTLDAISLLDFVSDVSVSQALWSKLGESAQKIVYYPFNNRVVMDTAFSIPWDAKLVEQKGVLRDVARQVGVPEFIIRRPKANFTITSVNWAAPGGPFEPLVPLAAKIWSARELREMQCRPRSGPTFWTMVNYAVWKRLFIAGEPLSNLLGEIPHAGPPLASDQYGILPPVTPYTSPVT